MGVALVYDIPHAASRDMMHLLLCDAFAHGMCSIGVVLAEVTKVCWIFK